MWQSLSQVAEDESQQDSHTLQIVQLILKTPERQAAVFPLATERKQDSGYLRTLTEATQLGVKSKHAQTPSSSSFRYSIFDKSETLGQQVHCVGNSDKGKG